MVNLLGERIRIARKNAGITQEALAKKLGIAYQTLNKYEKGKRIPDAELIRQMVIELGCDPAWLLTGEDTKHASLEKLSEIQEMIKEVTVQEEKATYGMTNRQRFWLEAMTQFDQVQGAEHLRRIIYDALRAAHVPVDEIEKRYRY